MKDPDAGFIAFHVMILWATVILVSGYQLNPRQQIMYAAENRALLGFAYARKSVHSRAICGWDCSRDERCKSFNLNDCNKMCELNLATRREHPGNFTAIPGSVYFDADEDTPLSSLTGISLNRYRSCKMLLDAGHRSSGIYTIYADAGCSLRVYCDMETDGGGWIVFQRRQDGSVDFYRNWTEYQSGFGDLSGEFWLGNDNLVTLTSDASGGTWEIRVDLGNLVGNTAWAKYSDFQISPGEYNLNIGQYDDNSTAGNALKYHNGSSFSTKDRDTDSCGSCNCAQSFSGAWWFKNCCHSHLNGPYYTSGYISSWCKGVYWWHWKRTSYYSLKTCSMKMRETAP